MNPSSRAPPPLSVDADDGGGGRKPTRGTYSKNSRVKRLNTVSGPPQRVTPAERDAGLEADYVVDLREEIAELSRMLTRQQLELVQMAQRQSAVIKRLEDRIDQLERDKPFTDTKTLDARI